MVTITRERSNRATGTITRSPSTTAIVTTSSKTTSSAPAFVRGPTTVCLDSNTVKKSSVSSAIASGSKRTCWNMTQHKIASWCRSATVPNCSFRRDNCDLPRTPNGDDRRSTTDIRLRRRIFRFLASVPGELAREGRRAKRVATPPPPLFLFVRESGVSIRSIARARFYDRGRFARSGRHERKREGKWTGVGWDPK